MLHACQVAATAGALRAALPAAMLGDESAIQAAAVETANLSRLASSLSDQDQSPLVSRIKQNAGLFLTQKEVVLRVNRAAQLLRQLSSQALEASQNAFTEELADKAAPTRISAAGWLTMLTQRIGKSAAELLTLNGLDIEASFQLGKDVNSFREILAAMTNGNSELRINPAKTLASKQHLATLKKNFTSMTDQFTVVQLNLINLIVAREAQANLQRDLAALGDSTWKACSGVK